MKTFLQQIKNFYIREPRADFASVFFTPLDEAVATIEKRRRDKNLWRAVHGYVNEYTPKHFLGDQPVFYLSRHLATPSYEVLRFIDQTKRYPYKRIIGIDPGDKFVSANDIKHGLGKLQIIKGQDKKGDDIVENITVVDFSTYDGKPLSDVQTKFGTRLDLFHKKLFDRLPAHNEVSIVDETEWVEHNGRGDLVAQYKNMMAMLIVNGIMFESYPSGEESFVRNVLEPAFCEIEEKVGCRPLIVELVSPEMEYSRNWNAYPPEVYPEIIRLASA